MHKNTNVSEHMRLSTNYSQLFQLLCIDMCAICALCLLQSMESAVTSQESDSEVQSEARPGEEAGVEETAGCSTQSAAGETVTAASATQVPILTVPAPPKKIKRAAEQPEDKLLHKASELMTTNTAKISRQESAVPVPDQPVPNSTRVFCDMLYAELMSVSDLRTCEHLQYQLHSVVICSSA